jgi:glycosyltransferase involved in cell wall biosynthesis
VIFYVTFNDPPSGIYASQVIDVVRYIRTIRRERLRLIAFISGRGFFEKRKLMKKDLPDMIVLPMFPGVGRWRMNRPVLRLLCLLFRPRLIIGRGVLATHLALACRNKNREVVYDGRGAIAAEWQEYKVVTDKGLLGEIHTLEKEAILSSDFRLAVSEALVTHWQNTYGYPGRHHIVIPCTLNRVFQTTVLSPADILKNRDRLGLDKDDLVFIYSGSTAGWQSFGILYPVIKKIFHSQPRARLFFLSEKDDNIERLSVEFPGRIQNKKVKPSEVPDYLMAADYGLLLREQSITNQVASPVKFAEYLACGLRVIISGQLGDYSDFVVQHRCGYLMQTLDPDQITIPSFSEKEHSRQLAITHFTKEAFRESYIALVRS